MSPGGQSRLSPILKLLVVMKLAIILTLFTVYQAQAKVFGQQRISMQVQQTEIRKVLSDMEKKANVRFLYNYELKSLDQKVDFAVSNTSIRQALDKLLRQVGLTYKILDDNLIVILASGDKDYQDTRITGTVTGDNGQPLAGVSVKVKGTNNGVVTGNDGSFSLTAADDAVLQLTYVGYEDKEVPVNGQTSLRIQLTLSDKQLDQVVVVGYGSQRKKDVTGAVSVVTAADIANRPIVNTGEALQGKASGVQVVTNSGKPGAGLSIRIRGATSISAGNDPLYVVDGIPTTNVDAVNPNDIESISILKDASSAAIYGARAANGVVLITTKKGVAGKSSINLNVYGGWSKPTHTIEALNAQQYKDYIFASTGQTVNSDVNINWPGEVFRTGNQQNYQLSVAGGSEKTQHYISVAYTEQKGIIKPANFNRLSGRVNLTNKTTDWLTLNTNITLSRINSTDVTDNLPAARGGVVMSALTTPSTTPIYNPDPAHAGELQTAPGTNWENPYGAIIGRKDRNQNDRLLASLGADIKLLRGLVFKSRFGIDYMNYTYNHILDPLLTTYGRNQQGEVTQNVSKELVWLSEQTLNYAHNWGKHNFSALAGLTAQESHLDYTGWYGKGFPVSDRYQDIAFLLNESAQKAPSKSIEEWGLVSYLGRATYDYDGKYLLTANIRVDQSSKFQSDKRSATFPSFSAGWRISREDFMKSLPVINDLKLRVGWGRNGNQEGIGNYDYMKRYAINNTDPANPVLQLTNFYNPSLTWETTTQTNIGLDVSVLHARVTLSADWYYKKTKNVLVNLPITPVSGLSSITLNLGEMENKGFEFLLSTKNVVNGPVRWNTDFNMSFNRNKVTRLYSGMQIPFGNIDSRGNATMLREGYGLGEFYGYIAEGVDPKTGMMRYKDLDNNGELDPGDRTFIGSALPDFTYGMTNTVSWKNFDLSVFIQGSQGNKIFNASRIETEGMYNQNNQTTEVLRRWQKEGDITDIPKAVIGTGNVDNSQISTRFLENGSYLRFKAITLSYRLGKKAIDALKIFSSLSVYFTGQNLFTITKYKGYDPEVNSYGLNNNLNPSSNDINQSNIALGIDNGAYPQAKTFIFGINVGL